MGSRPVVVVGAGGHAKVVVSTLQAAGFTVASIYDDDPKKQGIEVLGVPVVGRVSSLDPSSARGVLAIGDNAIRARLARELGPMEWITVVHPASYVHPTARLGPGTVVFAGAVIQPHVSVASHVIINTGALVDHDCVVEDFVHVAPGVRLTGGVRVQRGAFLGTGSVVIPKRTIGQWTTVGAGGVVTTDLPNGVTAVGVPARVKEH